MSYIDQNLQPDERVVLRATLHAAIFLGPALAVVLALVLVPLALLVSTRSLPVTGALAAVSLTLLGWAFRRGLGALSRHRNAELTVTNQRLVYDLGGSRRRATLESRLAAIERIDIDPGLLGDALGFGTIVVTEVGGRVKGKLDYITAPEQVRACVEQYKQVPKVPAKKTMEISEEQAGAVTILQLDGRVVFERSEELEEKLLSIIRGGRTKLLVDCSGVKGIDSAGIGALARGYREAMEHGGGLAIISPSSRMSEALGYIRIPIPTFSNQADGLRSLE